MNFILLHVVVYALRFAVAVIALLAFSPARADVVPTPSTSVTRITVQEVPGGVEQRVRTATGETRYRWTPSDRGSADGSVRIDSGASAILIRYAPIWAGRRVERVSQQITMAGTRAIAAQRVSVDGQHVTLTLTARVVGGSLVIEAKADKPLLAGLRVATPAPALPDVAVPVRQTIPYDPMPFYRTADGLFASAFFDWGASAATRLDDGEAVYAPRTDGRRNRLHERLVVTAGQSIADVLPSSYWPRSRYYDRVGGRLVLDITETLPFATIERGLDRLIAGGLSNCILIVHVWQRLGYDNGLPVVLPANDYLGGTAVLRSIGAKAKAVGCEFALHQNYVDQYPNSGAFDLGQLARDASGRPMRAWLNTAVGQQSYALQPGLLAATARRYAEPIKATLGTTATFVDVNSSFLPWERVDMNAAQPEGGRFRAFLAGSKAMFEAMQDVEQGPVFGEGHRHFYWTGALDGVDAQLTSGYDGDVRTAPLWVDFDLLRIHPVQHNYGMGYYNRYAPATRTSRDPMTEERTRDIYRAQQLAFAHLPYRSETLWDDLRLFVQEAALSVPVARAYARAGVREIRYPLAGRWVPIETAWSHGPARAVRIGYDNDLAVTVNTGIQPIADATGRVLGEASWSAIGDGLTGWSTTLRNMRHDFMQAPGVLYADPREIPGNWQATPARQPVGVDFGPIRTDGQTWFSCLRGYWNVLGIAQRGIVAIEVNTSAIARPSLLRGQETPDVRPSGTPAGLRWQARLASGRRYTTDTRCAID